MIPGVRGVTNSTHYCRTCEAPGHLPGVDCPRNGTLRQVQIAQPPQPDMPHTCVLQSTLPVHSVHTLARSAALNVQAAQTHCVQSNGLHSHISAARLRRLQSTPYCRPGLQSLSRRMLPPKRAAKPAAPAVSYVCATSAPDLDTIVHGLIAVKGKGKGEQQHAVKFLIDTGATESCISEAFVHRIDAKLRSKPETLSMANGSLAHSEGLVVLPINMQDYWSEVVFKVFPMNSHFDVILGRDWCNYVACDILYSAGLMRFQSPATGKFHEVVLQPVSHGIVCPVISSVDLDKHIEAGDTVYICHVTAQAAESNASDHDKVQVILEQYQDVFPDELPAELPPERSVYHTIPLKDSNAVPPARKSYRLSQPELQECT